MRALTHPTFIHEFTMPNQTSIQPASSPSENSILSIISQQYKAAAMNTALDQINAAMGRSVFTDDRALAKAQIKDALAASHSSAQQQFVPQQQTQTTTELVPAATASTPALQQKSIADTIRDNYLANIAKLGLSEQDLAAMNDPTKMTESQKNLQEFLANLPAGSNLSVSDLIQANYLANVAALGLSDQNLAAMNDPSKMTGLEDTYQNLLKNLPTGSSGLAPADPIDVTATFAAIAGMKSLTSQPADPYAQAQADTLKHLERTQLSADSSAASLFGQGQGLDPVQAMNANLESKGIRLNG
jgi:hypothetical protein